MTTREPGGSVRLAGIEGLRAAAAASVLIYHVWLYSVPTADAPNFGLLDRLVFPHLALGVTLFFVLSGFLLYRPHVRAALQHRSAPTLGRYVRNRALRILPAYWVVLVCTAVVLPAALIRVSPTELTLGRLARDPELLFRNLALVQTYFPNSLLTGLAPAWSLSVEVAFYAALPGLGWLVTRATRTAAGSRRPVLCVVAPVVLLFLIGWSGKWVVGSVLRQASGSNPGWDGDLQSVLMRSFWAHAELFAFGMVLAVVCGVVDHRGWRPPKRWRGLVASTSAVAAVAVALLADAGVTGPGRLVYEDLAALVCTLLLALVVVPDDFGAQGGRLVRLLERRPVAAAGIVSYSVFLWHEPLVRYLRALGVTRPGNAGFVINLVMIATITGILAWATYRLVERPVLRRKPVTRANDGVIASATAT